MPSYPRGLYELLITEDARQALGALGSELTAHRQKLEPAEAPDRLAQHLALAVRRVLASVPDDERVAVGVDLIRQLIAQLPVPREGDDPLRDVHIPPIVNARSAPS